MLVCSLTYALGSGCPTDPSSTLGMGWGTEKAMSLKPVQCTSSGQSKEANSIVSLLRKLRTAALGCQPSAKPHSREPWLWVHPAVAAGLVSTFTSPFYHT